jgi:hypothetical protein
VMVLAAAILSLVVLIPAHILALRKERNKAWDEANRANAREQECRRRSNSVARGRSVGGGVIVRCTTVPSWGVDDGDTIIHPREALRCTPTWTNGPRSAVVC